MTRRRKNLDLELRMPTLVGGTSWDLAVLKLGWEQEACAKAVLQDRKISVAWKAPRLLQRGFILGWGSLWQLGGGGGDPGENILQKTKQNEK